MAAGGRVGRSAGVRGAAAAGLGDGRSFLRVVRDEDAESPDDATATVKAVFDSGSFYTIVREDQIPSLAAIVRRKVPRILRAAARGSLTAVGEVSLVLAIGDHPIDHDPDITEVDYTVPLE